MDKSTVLQLSPFVIAPLEMNTSNVIKSSNLSSDEINSCNNVKIKTFYYIGIVLLILVILFLVIFLTIVYTMDLELTKKKIIMKKNNDENIDEYTKNYNYVNQNYNIDINDLNRY